MLSRPGDSVSWGSMRPGEGGGTATWGCVHVVSPQVEARVKRKKIIDGAENRSFATKMAHGGHAYRAGKEFSGGLKRHRQTQGTHGETRSHSSNVLFFASVLIATSKGEGGG
uniref:Uncharacterized protein n=1 Tax=Eutreptiella gymnastica TaxID=73025 RepID=A0A7S4LI73_9EUGL